MLNDKLKNQLHLHFIVFIWGFTAILAALISIDAMSLVWFRVLIASVTSIGLGCRQPCGLIWPGYKGENGTIHYL